MYQGFSKGDGAIIGPVTNDEQEVAVYFEEISATSSISC